MKQQLLRFHRQIRFSPITSIIKYEAIKLWLPTISANPINASVRPSVHPSTYHINLCLFTFLHHCFHSLNRPSSVVCSVSLCPSDRLSVLSNRSSHKFTHSRIVNFAYNVELIAPQWVAVLYKASSGLNSSHPQQVKYIYSLSAQRRHSVAGSQQIDCFYSKPLTALYLAGQWSTK